MALIVWGAFAIALMYRRERCRVSEDAREGGSDADAAPFPSALCEYFSFTGRRAPCRRPPFSLCISLRRFRRLFLQLVSNRRRMRPRKELFTFIRKTVRRDCFASDRCDAARIETEPTEKFDFRGTALPHNGQGVLTSSRNKRDRCLRPPLTLRQKYYIMQTDWRRMVTFEYFGPCK